MTKSYQKRDGDFKKARAIELRKTEGLSASIIAERLGLNKERVEKWLRGIKKAQ